MSCFGIQSNLVLSYNQIEPFLLSINPNSIFDNDVRMSIDKWQDEEKVPVYEIILLFHRSSIISHLFIKLQASLIKNIIGVREYNIINRRIMLYDQNSNEKYNITEIPINCYEKMYQYLTGIPNQYYSNYRKLNADFFYTPDHILSSIRELYGYSKRLTSSKSRDRSSSSDMVSRKSKLLEQRKISSTIHYHAYLIKQSVNE